MPDIVSIDILGFTELQEIINDLPRRMRYPLIIRALKRAGKPLLKEARSRVPISGKKTVVKTVSVYNRKKKQYVKSERKRSPGQLKRSLGMIEARDKLMPAVWVGPRRGNKAKDDGWYGHFLEFGTIKQGAQPYMRPSFDQQKEQIPELVRRELEAEIVKVFKKAMK